MTPVNSDSLVADRTRRLSFLYYEIDRFTIARKVFSGGSPEKDSIQPKV